MRRRFSLELCMSKKRRISRRLIVGDLVFVGMLWSTSESDWVDSDAVGIVVELNDSDELEGMKTNKCNPEYTLVSVLVNGEVLEEEYYERDLRLIE